MKNLGRALAALLFLAGCGESQDARPDGDDDGGEAICGNGSRDATEVCDGADLAGATCDSIGFSGGVLACQGNCADYDRSGCGAPASCGDDLVQAPELCDGADLAGKQCQDLGFAPGMLACASNCGGFDTSRCGRGASCPAATTCTTTRPGSARSGRSTTTRCCNRTSI